MIRVRMSATLRPRLVTVSDLRFAVRTTNSEAKHTLTDASECIMHLSRACKKACWISMPLDPIYTRKPAQADEPLIRDRLANLKLLDRTLVYRIHVCTAMCTLTHRTQDEAELYCP